MFKSIHNIIPTWDRIDRICNKHGQSRGSCYHCPGVKDNIFYALTQCKINKPAADFMLGLIRKIHQNAIMFDIIYLQCDTKGLMDLPITWITIKCIHLIWTNRLMGGITPNRLFDELMALYKIFKNTRFKAESLAVGKAQYGA